MIVYQGSDSSEFIIRLLDNMGAIVTGVAYDEVILKRWKPGLLDFEDRTFIQEEWDEIGNGYYIVKFRDDPTDWDVIGNYLLRFTGNSFEEVVKEVSVIAPPLNAVTKPSQCIITGNIVDIGGNPGKGQQIRIRPVDFPSQSQDTHLLTSDEVLTIPDAEGNFSVALIREQKVVFEISRTGIRNQITVPDQQTADILDLLPPIS